MKNKTTLTWRQGNFAGYLAYYAISKDGYYWGRDAGEIKKTRCKTYKGFCKWVACK